MTTLKDARSFNTDSPIFIIGAPKCASTALHITFSKSGLVNYAPIKDTKYLSNRDFNLSVYREFFFDNNLRLFEADQNLAISSQAFQNIKQNFTNPTLIYVLRSPKDRFLSALAWLKKNGLAANAKQAFEQHNNWLIAHGKYEENIMANIHPNLDSGDRLILVSFEKLTRDGGTTLHSLFEAVNLIPPEDIALIQHNRSVKPRNKALVASLRGGFSKSRLFIPKPIQEFIKNSKIVEKALYTNTPVEIETSDLEFYNTIKYEFDSAELLWARVNESGILSRA